MQIFPPKVKQLLIELEEAKKLKADKNEMGSQWRKVKLALGFNTCVHIPRDFDDSSSSRRPVTHPVTTKALLDHPPHVSGSPNPLRNVVGPTCHVLKG
ncbi:hypothetical protein TanjilG_03088 [Lupinus angustifolius]|uniref:Uncharacterized protein n=1 Tax=Lupinus angustifolius TaxID=3871 RepID=A0A4P1RCU8_LUPAN|nr:hypothetical protein TanjilG_03088 [Lupinus angustifolius]